MHVEKVLAISNPQQGELGQIKIKGWLAWKAPAGILGPGGGAAYGGGGKFGEGTEGGGCAVESPPCLGSRGGGGRLTLPSPDGRKAVHSAHTESIRIHMRGC